MLIVLSPAKKLLQSTPYAGISSQPLFMEKTQTLVELMQAKSVEDIAQLMDLSTDLAQLNFERYQQFSLNTKTNQAHPAIFLFQGDVYQGLQAATWPQHTVEYAQSHLRILSGLYGVLKPLDCIQPYRLEMGVRLENPAGKNLYGFWQNTITEALKKELKSQQNPILINLASNEYFKVIDTKNLGYPIITINFYERKNGQLKMVGIHAKKARGVMAQFVMKNQIDDPKKLSGFNGLGYQYYPETSTDSHLDFVRD